MVDLFKELVKLRFHMLIFLAGLAMLYLSYFSSFPNPGNGWIFGLRQNAHSGLIALGILLVAFSVIIFVLSNDNGGSPRVLFSREIKREFENLSDTQKDVLRTLYEIHRKEVTVEFFHEMMNQKFPGKISSPDELYFRLKDLAHKRLLYMRAVAKGSTAMRPLKKVGRVLNFPSG